MRQEWIERMHDQAHTEMGYCVQDGRIWCSRHDSGKMPGAESCNKMDEGYRIAESAGEVMEELARADERAQEVRLAAKQIKRDALADLRAKVEEWDKRYTLVEVSDVLALLEEES